MKEGRLTRRLKVRGDRDIRAPTVNDRRKKKERGNGWADGGGELGWWAGLRERGKRKAGGLAGFGLRREKNKDGRWAGWA
jgi:hypothetical protein